MDQQHINLQLNAHTVSLTIDRAQEQSYRQAAQLLNERFAFYAKRMHTASAEQLWMYVALESAVNLATDAREKSLVPVEKEVRTLDERILQVLGNK